jgi:hypothetical protein
MPSVWTIDGRYVTLACSDLSRLVFDKIKGTPPDTMHLQHSHGFKDNRQATCPTEATDTNHDGIIDLIEIEPRSWTTMVPFHDDSVSMEIVRDTCPKAGAGDAGGVELH